MAPLPYTSLNKTQRESSTLDFDLANAWVLSDTHFNHRNIATYEPIRQTLGADHNDVMLARWRDTVAVGDLVVHLGDVCLGKSGDFKRISDLLPGRKVLVKGNHDSRSRAWYAEHGFKVIPAFWAEHRGWRIRFQHYPDYDRELVQYPRTLVVHGHVHSKTLDDPRHLNVSVEAQGFTPKPLMGLVDARLDQLAAPAA